MATTRCRHCAMPMTEAEAATGICPDCGQSLQDKSVATKPETVEPAKDAWPWRTVIVLGSLLVGVAMTVLVVGVVANFPRTQVKEKSPEENDLKASSAEKERMLAELKSAAAKASKEREAAEKKGLETKQLLEKLAEERALAEKVIADAKTAEKVLAEAKAALPKVKPEPIKELPKPVVAEKPPQRPDPVVPKVIAKAAPVKKALPARVDIAIDGERGSMRGHPSNVLAPERGSFVHAFRFAVFDGKRAREMPAPAEAFGLDLAENPLDADAFRQLGRFDRLVSLNLKGNALAPADVVQIARCESLQALDLGSTGIFDDDVKQLAGLRKLWWLGLSHNPGVADEAMKTVAQLDGLRLLDLQGTKVTNVGLREITRLKNLEALYLYYAYFNDEGLKEVAKLSRLEILDLSRTGTSDVGLQELAALQKLRVLDVRRTRVTDSSMASFAKMAGLKELRLVTRRVSDKGIIDLSTHQGLELLNLAACSLTDESARHLRKMSGLKFLNVGSTQLTDDGLLALADLKNLRVVDVTRTKVTPDGVKRFLERHKDCQVILEPERDNNLPGIVGELQELDLKAGVVKIVVEAKNQVRTLGMRDMKIPAQDAAGKAIDLKDLLQRSNVAVEVNEADEVIAIRLVRLGAFPTLVLPRLQWRSER